MTSAIILSSEAIENFRSLKAHVRARVRAVIERHLRSSPTVESKSRIKRLRGLSRPQFRLRVDEIRVYYDVFEGIVEILAIIPKSEAETWLERVGRQE